MSIQTKDTKTDTKIPTTPPGTRSGKVEFDLRHILTTIVLDTSEIENVIVTQKIKRFELIEYIMEGQLKGMSDISYGSQVYILNLQKW